MLLNVAERVALVTALPKEGNFVTLKIVVDLKDKLGFSDDEIEKFKIEYTDTAVKWGAAEDSEKEIEILPTQMDVCCKALEALNAREALTPMHMSVYGKFLGNGDGTKNT